MAKPRMKDDFDQKASEEAFKPTPQAPPAYNPAQGSKGFKGTPQGPSAFVATPQGPSDFVSTPQGPQSSDDDAPPKPPKAYADIVSKAKKSKTWKEIDDLLDQENEEANNTPPEGTRDTGVPQNAVKKYEEYAKNRAALRQAREKNADLILQVQWNGVKEREKYYKKMFKELSIIQIAHFRI